MIQSVSVELLRNKNYLESITYLISECLNISLND